MALEKDSKLPGMDKLKAIEDAVSAIEKQFGKGAIMRLGEENTSLTNIQALSTGSLSLDLALGIGGVPYGRIIEIFGPESSGKTTLSLHLVAEAQKKGGVAAFVDAEHALDTSYAKRIGVQLDQMLISQPDTGEQALEIVDTLVKTNAVDIIIVDSVAALTPKAEIEGDMGDHHVGSQARLMSQALRKLTSAVSHSKCIVVFINQIRMKIGVMFGSPETTTGGNALKFYSSVRLDVRRINSLKEGEDVKGNRVRVKVVKNKVAAPFKQVEFDVMFGSGISREGDTLDLAVQMDLIKKSGSWFSYEGERLGQGREAVKDFLVENKKVLETIESKIKELSGLMNASAASGKDAKTPLAAAKDTDKGSSKEPVAKAVGSVAAGQVIPSAAMSKAPAKKPGVSPNTKH